MLIITDVLPPEDVAKVREELKGVAFVDGKKTAGGEARKVKANRQADVEDEKVKALMKFVRQALERSAVYQIYARPARKSGVMFNAYGVGETYGLHVDETLMGSGLNRIRTDFSYTLFLSDPSEYEGGELVVVGTEGARSVRPTAGSMVVYSTGRLH